MADDPSPRRITGPLRSWCDIHEALAHEARALADLAPTAIHLRDSLVAHLEAEDAEILEDDRGCLRPVPPP